MCADVDCYALCNSAAMYSLAHLIPVCMHAQSGRPSGVCSDCVVFSSAGDSCESLRTMMGARQDDYGY